MCYGHNSQYFHIIRDGHQPNSKGLYSHYKDSLLKVDDHPQRRSLDLGTHDQTHRFCGFWSCSAGLEEPSDLANFRHLKKSGMEDVVSLCLCNATVDG